MFVRSSRSDAAGNQCVEVAALSGGIWIRDSKDPVRVTGVSRQAWAHFVRWL